MSMRKAINAKCKDCIYDDQTAGTWRQQVGDCQDDVCPLFALRPLPTGQKRDAPLPLPLVKRDNPENGPDRANPGPSEK